MTATYVELEVSEGQYKTETGEVIKNGERGEAVGISDDNAVVEFFNGQWARLPKKYLKVLIDIPGW